MKHPDTVAGRIAAWISSPHALGPMAASPEGRRLACTAIIDTLGCAWAGRQDATVRKVAATVPLGAGASRLLTGGMTDAAFAGMVNGTAAHVLDFDDNFAPGMSHASAVIVPALLAVALEATSGRDLVDAYLVALQAQAFVGNGLGNGHYTAGWHGTSTVGSIGTAAGVAWLLGGDTDAIRRALTLAASFASGTKGQFGTPAKPFHAGLAARNAIEAARLALSGLEGHPRAFEGEQGIAEMFRGPGTPGYDLDAITATTRNVVETVGVVPKLHPCCGSTHFVIDVLADLRRDHDIAAEDVARYEVHVGIANMRNLPYIHPVDEMQARFSMSYCMARALRAGQLGLQDFTPAAVAANAADPLLDVMTMTAWTEAEEVAAMARGERLPHRLRLHMRDGRVLEGERLAPIGALADPFPPEALAAKFIACLGGGQDAAMLHARLLQLDDWPDLNPIAALCDGSAVLR